MLLSLSVFLLSSSVLFFEIVLIRLLSLSHWQPFVTLAVSVALLGFGISGTLLGRTKNIVFPNRKLFYPLAAGLASLAYRPAAFFAQKLHMEPGLIVRDPSQWMNLAALVVILIVPFTMAFFALALPLLEKETVGTFYGWNLTGSCFGVLASLLAMSFLPPASLAQAAAVLAALAFIASVMHYYRPSLPVFLISALALTTAAIPPAGPIQFGQFKDISYALNLPGSRIALERFGFSGKLQVVTAPSIRSASGLSMEFSGKLPPQAAFFRDGNRIGTLILSEREDESTDYLKWQTASAPYLILPKGSSIAILGFEGGQEIARARINRVSRVSVVEPDSTAVRTAEKKELFKPWIFNPKLTEFANDRARHFFVSGKRSFDAVIFHLSSNLASAAAGFTGASEDYRITVQGIESALGSLSPAGIIAITGWNQAPPTGRWKILETLKRIPLLYDAGFSDRVYLIEGWSTHTFMIKPSGFSRVDVAILENFCNLRKFTLQNAGNFPLSLENLTPWATGISESDLDLRPATDSRPYPWHSLKTSYLKRLSGRLREAAFPRVEWGFFFLVMALLINGMLTVPLLFFSRPATSAPGSGMTYFFYFASLGVGYMLIEILFIKRAGLIMGPAQLCAAVVVAFFLLFSGLGSRKARRMSLDSKKIASIFMLIMVFSASAYFVVPYLIPLSKSIRIGLLGVILFPAAFLMGFPFPLGLQTIRDNRESRVPWAWAITGYTSVVGSSLAGVLAVTTGFHALLLLGMVCYGLAGLLSRSTICHGA